MNDQNEVNSDYELLRDAAKAAGLMTDGWHRDGGIAVWMPGQESKYWFNWNPLTDDGDAFRLAVELSMSINVVNGLVGWTAADVWVHEKRIESREPHKSDAYAATRRAIVRAAAEIGRNMV